MPLTARQQLEKLVNIGNRFRRTPIVDSDFEALRNEFDSVLAESTKRLEELPKTKRVLVDGCMVVEECDIEL